MLAHLIDSILIPYYGSSYKGQTPIHIHAVCQCTPQAVIIYEKMLRQYGWKSIGGGGRAPEPGWLGSI